MSDIRFDISRIVGNMGAPLHTASSFGSQTLYSRSQASYLYSPRGAQSDDGKTESDWEMEDEDAETSSDPLVAGLIVGRSETVELSAIGTKEV